MNWETGRFEPPIRWLPAILHFLGYDPFPAPTTVGQRLLHVRRQHGWSTSEAARQLGVERTTWQDWERGELILLRKHRLKVATPPASTQKKWPKKCELAGMESIGAGNVANPRRTNWAMGYSAGKRVEPDCVTGFDPVAACRALEKQTLADLLNGVCSRKSCRCWRWSSQSQACSIHASGVGRLAGVVLALVDLAVGDRCRREEGESDRQSRERGSLKHRWNLTYLKCPRRGSTSAVAAQAN